MNRHPHHAHQVKKGFMRLFVLQNLFVEPMHGYALMRRIWERSGGFWTPRAGFIYPLLRELLGEGLIELQGKEGRRRIYKITQEGKAELIQLHREAEDAIIHLTEVLSSDEVDPVQRHLALMEELPTEERAERMESRLRTLDKLIESLSRAKQELERYLSEEV